MQDKANLLNKECLILFLENQIHICSSDPNTERYSDRLYFLNAFIKEVRTGRFDYFDNTPMLYLEKIT